MAAPVPVMAPPYGKTSDFSRPNSLLRWDVVAISICLSVTTVLFLLHVYVRGFIKREWVFEDRESCDFVAYVSGLTSCQIWFA